jgi:hypothetical protein
MEEPIQEAPFDRYADLSELTHIRIGIDDIIHIACRHRKVKQPVKSALFADNPLSFSVAHSYELLMCGAMIEVQAFKKRAARLPGSRCFSERWNAIGKGTKDNNKTMTP